MIAGGVTFTGREHPRPDTAAVHLTVTSQPHKASLGVTLSDPESSVEVATIHLTQSAGIKLATLLKGTSL